MSRFLFVVPPLAGHTFPTVALGRELTGRGHQIAWAGHPKYVDPLLPAGMTLLPVAAGDDLVAALLARSPELRGVAALRFLWQDFLIPLAQAMVPGVTAAVAQFNPDVLVVDQQAMAGALVAHRRGLPWATSATTSAELIDHFTSTPRLGTWVGQHMGTFQTDLGVSDPVDLRFSTQLVLAFTTPELVGGVGTFPEHYVFVGPAIGARTGTVTFPWDWLDPDRRHVLVSLGTANPAAGRRFFATALAAVAPLAERMQVIFIAPSELLEAPPEHVLVREFVPQLDLLPFLHVVVSHAGHNTVCESLAHGVPLVVAPIRDDQPVIASQVTDAGAGIRVLFSRVGATELREAITAVLEEPHYRRAAQRVQASFTAAGGAAAAADQLEKLA